MGPIGVLCVQRTLNEGRKHGLFTGIGAAISDILFAIIAGLGIGYVIDFIETNQNPLLIFGSLILLVFGYFIFRSNPAKKLKKQERKSEPVWKDFVSSFFLNMSNIGILFLYIALFARLDLIVPNQPFSYSIAGIAAIGAGAIFWWILISYIVDRLRDRFNLRGLVFFNRILGVILILLGVGGFFRGVYHWMFHITMHASSLPF
ncbi:MAG: LysE family translocator [Dysgonomonas sp.]